MSPNIRPVVPARISRRLGLSRRQAEVVRMAVGRAQQCGDARDLGLQCAHGRRDMGEALERLGVRSRTLAANLIHQLDVRDRSGVGSPRASRPPSPAATSCSRRGSPGVRSPPERASLADSQAGQVGCAVFVITTPV